MANVIPCVCAVKVAQSTRSSCDAEETPMKAFSKEDGSNRNVEDRKCEQNEETQNECDQSESSVQCEEETRLLSTDETSFIDCNSDTPGNCSHALNESTHVCRSTNTHGLPLTTGNKNVTSNANKIWGNVKASQFVIDPVLNFIILTDFFFGIVYVGWHIFLIPHALQRGISIDRTLVITLCAAVGNFSSRITVGFLTNKLVKPMNMFLFLSIFNAFSLLCYAFNKNFYIMIFLSCLSAIAIGGRAVLVTIILRERASPQGFAIAYAFMEVGFGIGALLGGYLSGIWFQFLLSS